VVAALNLGYFVVEFAVARAIGSVSLFADSVDFLEDTTINILIVVGLAWSLRARTTLAMGLAGVVLVPAVAAVWTTVDKLLDPEPPGAVPLSWTAAGALAVNATAAWILVRHRDHPGGLVKAAWLSARNDSLGNAAIIVAGLVTAAWPTIWPDVIVGTGLAALNLHAAKEVWEAAREERAAGADARA